MKFSIENAERFINIEPKKQEIEEILIWLKDEKNTMELVFITIKIL